MSPFKPLLVLVFCTIAAHVSSAQLVTLVNQNCSENGLNCAEGLVCCNNGICQKPGDETCPCEVLNDCQDGFFCCDEECRKPEDCFCRGKVCAPGFKCCNGECISETLIL